MLTSYVAAALYYISSVGDDDLVRAVRALGLPEALLAQPVQVLLLGAGAHARGGDNNQSATPFDESNGSS